MLPAIVAPEEINKQTNKQLSQINYLHPSGLARRGLPVFLHFHSTKLKASPKQCEGCPLLQLEPDMTLRVGRLLRCLEDKEEVHQEVDHSQEFALLNPFVMAGDLRREPSTAESEAPINLNTYNSDSTGLPN
jgi:hypothetical protein